MPGRNAQGAEGIVHKLQQGTDVNCFLCEGKLTISPASLENSLARGIQYRIHR